MAFSSFKAIEAYSVLDTAKQYADDVATEFPLAPYDPMAPTERVLQECLDLHTHGDVVQHVGKELALRCCKTDPRQHTKEASKRELIGPVIFAAATLAGVPSVCVLLPSGGGLPHAACVRACVGMCGQSKCVGTCVQACLHARCATWPASAPVHRDGEERDMTAMCAARRRDYTAYQPSVGSIVSTAECAAFSACVRRRCTCRCVESMPATWPAACRLPNPPSTLDNSHSCCGFCG